MQKNIFMIGLEISPPMTDRICRWFMSASSSERVELLCSLLQICLPQELWFLGACIEDRGRKDASQLLLEEEKKSNSITEYENMSIAESDFFDSVFLKRMITHLSLLKSSNSKCADRLFTFIVKIHKKLISSGNELKILNDISKDDLLLLFTLSAFHPAFIFKQRLFLSSILIDFKRVINELKYYRYQSENPEAIHSNDLPTSAQIAITPCAVPSMPSGETVQSPLLTMVSPLCTFTESKLTKQDLKAKDCFESECPSSTSLVQAQRNGCHKNKSRSSGGSRVIPPITPSVLSTVAQLEEPQIIANDSRLMEGMVKGSRRKFVGELLETRKTKEKSVLLESSSERRSFTRNRVQNKSSIQLKNFQHSSYPPSLDSSCSEDYLTPLGSPDIHVVRKEDYVIREGKAGENYKEVDPNQNCKESLQFPNQVHQMSLHTIHNDLVSQGNAGPCENLQLNFASREAVVVHSDPTLVRHDKSPGLNVLEQPLGPCQSSNCSVDGLIYQNVGRNLYVGPTSPREIASNSVTSHFSSPLLPNPVMNAPYATSDFEVGNKMLVQERHLKEYTPFPGMNVSSIAPTLTTIHAQSDRPRPDGWDPSLESATCHQCGQQFHAHRPSCVFPPWNVPWWYAPRPITMMLAPISLNNLLTSPAQLYHQDGYAQLPQKPLFQNLYISNDKFQMNETTSIKQSGQIPGFPHSVILLFDQNLKHFSGEHCANLKNTMCPNCGKFGHSSVACLEPSIDVELKTSS